MAAPPPQAPPGEPAVEPGDGGDESSVSTDGGEIVVIGTRLRGQVLTTQPPIAEYDEADIQAIGAGSLTELLQSLGPQVSSGRGRGGGSPVILVNGRRVSDFRELASYPPEAVRRVSILPEEVALQYGFPPDQRVVNFILKDDFASREVEAEFEQPDRGGYRATELELTYLKIDGADRLNANLELRETTALTAAERGVVLDEPALAGDPDAARFRTLVGPSSSAEATLNWSRGLGTEGAGGVLALNASYARSDTRSLDGLSGVLLVAPDGRSARRTLPLALATDVNSDTYALGATLDRSLGDWRLNATLDARLVELETLTGNGADTAELAAAALAGTLAVDADLPQPSVLPGEVARSRTMTLDNIYTLSGRILDLPAGRVQATVDAQYKWNRIESADTLSLGEITLSRSRLSGGANFNIPVAEPDGFLGAIGKLDLTLGGGIDHLSDFGTLWDANLGLTWRPTEKLTFQASFIPREAAPTLTQLGAPVIVTPNVPVFDFVTGRTALVTIMRGGNPDLVAEQQRDLKLAVNWELPEIAERISDGSLDLEYFRNRSRDVSASFPLLTPAIQAAFPSRITRDADGDLVAIDQSPVTFAQQESSRLRFALNLGGSFASDEQGGGRGGEAGRPQGGAPGGAAAPGGPGARGGPGGGGPPMLRGGPPPGGRWRVTIDYTRELENTVLVAPGGPRLDLLDGDALVTGGVPADRVGARLFGFYKGYGGRVAFDWFGSTEVRGSGLPGTSDLTFGSLARLDLRLFTDLERVVPDEPALKGVRLSFLVNNVFDARQRVTDADGNTPARFQPFLLDPTGRYVGVEVRKLFL